MSANRHQAQANRDLAGEVGNFVEGIRLWDHNATITMLRLPDGRGYDRRPDESHLTAVSSKDMALWDKKRKGCYKAGE